MIPFLKNQKISNITKAILFFDQIFSIQQNITITIWKEILILRNDDIITGFGPPCMHSQQNKKGVSGGNSIFIWKSRNL